MNSINITCDHAPTLYSKCSLLGGQSVNNRFFKSAMSEQLGNSRLLPDHRLARAYQRWAKGGTAILVTGNVLRYQNFDRDSATLRSRVLKDRLISVLELFLRKFGGTCIWKYQMPWRDWTRYEGLKTVIVSHLCISPAKYNDYLHNKL